MRPVATRAGIAVSGAVLVALGAALAGDQLVFGLLFAAFGLFVAWVASRPELGGLVVPQQRFTAAAGHRTWVFTALALFAVALVASWLADGSEGGLLFGGLALAASAPGVGWMVDVWRVRLGRAG
ncbi:MAG: hypothetical protein JWM05_852 [Acidimicrobiales bacterium]|nr:hypothetical protein [Acidimicrobiales bacterium]